MILEWFIIGVLLCVCVRYIKKSAKLERRVLQLEHDNAKLELDACRLAAKLTTAKRLLAARSKGGAP